MSKISENRCIEEDKKSFTLTMTFLLQDSTAQYQETSANPYISHRGKWEQSKHLGSLALQVIVQEAYFCIAPPRSLRGYTQLNSLRGARIMEKRKRLIATTGQTSKTSHGFFLTGSWIPVRNTPTNPIRFLN